MNRRLIQGAALAAGLVALAPAASAAATDGPAPAQQQQEKKKRKDKDKEKDKKPASPAKVFTDDDLKKYSEERAAKAAEGEGADATAQGQESESSSPPAEEEHGGKQAWADRARQARDKIAEAEARVEALQARITELRNDRGSANAMDPFRLQTIQAEIQKATEELDAANKELQAARAGLDKVVEDARRQGVPPGWVREP